MGTESGNPHVVRINFSLSGEDLSWSVSPNPLPIPPGKAEINWMLTGADFDPANGIVFPDAKNPKPWPGTPEFVNAQKFRSDDDNTAGKGDPRVLYHYTINVTHDGQAYSLDPDVSNDPPPGGGPQKP
jgi:hypothetical protein